MSAPPADDTSRAPLTVSREERDGRVVFGLVGDIDLETSRRLRTDLLEGLPSGNEDVVVDMTRVDFMDSSGLAALVGAWKVVRDAGSFRVAGANSVVKRVLTITGMEDVFDIHPDLESALRSS
ncbi:STAS domain-containing protein [Aeromicrobium sp. Leaf350]|uniref:STAS domain-containing protein n=1 Tax=Aeromicrobium sp. Leaf350 TaxID=2876565 RepID=UPI001E291875|nr:STAS domain-containing protein [Aeromicrobium sp. Leaf350]